ncbi:MAG: hypothetical protein R3Y51_01835 [Rikenellaceae bacterium]
MKTTKITMLLLLSSMVLVSCNKTDEVSPPSSSSTNSVTLRNEIDASRLSSMNVNEDIWTRSTGSYAGDITILDCPSVPTANLVDLSTTESWGYSAQSGEVLYVPSGYTHSAAVGFTSTGTDLYVAGNLVIDPYTWGKGTIYVLEGASVTFPAGYALSDIEVQSWGDMIFEGNFTLNSSSAIYSYSDSPIELKGSGHELTLQINSNFEVVGSVTADKIEIVGADAYSTARTVKFGSCVNVSTFDVSNYGEVYLSSAGLVADVVDLHSYSNIYLTSGTLVLVTDAINFENYSCFVNLSTDYAVIDTKLVTIDNNTFINRINGGPVDLNYETIEDDNSGNVILWTANVVFNKDTYVASNGCHSGFGSDTGESDEPVLEHDSAITSPNIERISATSIDFNDGRVFVSWHEAEANYQGYIDVVNMDNMEIEATLYTTELDFNHIYVNGGVAYVTGGDNKSGAFYSEVIYNTGGSSVDVDVIYIEGSSGNCITIEGNDKWVVSGSNGGLTIVGSDDVQNYTELSEAKFVEPYNGGMAVLAGISSTYVYEYDLDGSLSKSYNVGSIDPVDGKNTLHADDYDGTIYACLSLGGLKVYNNGVQTQSLATELIGSVNCVDTDENYVYVANGTAGLLILNKSDLSEVKRYVLGDASANYVKLGEDGYIYVAYGLKGVHRFRLVD